MWGSVRGRSVHGELISAFKNVELPKILLTNYGEIPTALGQVEVYASACSAFSAIHGHPAQSIWAQLDVSALPTYEIGDLVDTLEEMRGLAGTILSIARQNEGLLTKQLDEARRIANAAPELEQSPNAQALGYVVPLDLNELERALELNQSLKTVLSELDGKADLSAFPTKTLSRASAIVAVDNRPEVTFGVVSKLIQAQQMISLPTMRGSIS